MKKQESFEEAGRDFTDVWDNDGNTDEGKYGVALVSYPTLTGDRTKDVVKVLYMQRTTNS